MPDFEERVKRYEAMTQAELDAEFDRGEKDTLGFVNSEPVTTETLNHGRFQLTITTHKTEDGCWNYSKGQIVCVGIMDLEPIIIPRNYHSFWHVFVDHPNGNQYLLCGHDYQGYDCINLTTWVRHKYVPRAALWGCGFCWAKVEYDKEKNQVVVDGCYWACPYEIVRYDFSNPDTLPFPELSREEPPPEPDDDEEAPNT